MLKGEKLRWYGTPFKDDRILNESTEVLKCGSLVYGLETD